MEIKDIENLAELAKVDLPEEEKQALLHDMDVIVAYVRQIEEIDVPDSLVDYEHYNAWRDDVETERDFSMDLIQKQFPDSEAGYVKVKKILG